MVWWCCMWDNQCMFRYCLSGCQVMHIWYMHSQPALCQKAQLYLQLPAPMHRQANVDD